MFADRQPSELPGMLATLCSYEDRFGPHHPQTLILMAQLGVAYRQAGRADLARPLLVNSVRDLAQHVGKDNASRLQAMAALRDLDRVM